LAKELGWFVTLADGRSHLVKPERFPAADALSMLSIADLPVQPGVKPIQEFARIQPGDAVVVMSHSFEQDSKILASLLQLQAPPAYIGVLGPQRRTRELLAEAGRLLSLPEAEISTQVDRWMGCLHAPTGLDLGAESPETIALSILAEIQKERSIATALPLRDVRGAALAAMP
jgi:xanthine/CO dehydrogenase XdhC/CoxF family maturation factor